MNEAQLALIFDLQQAADAIGLPIWLSGGWAVDARLRRITREHEDIDLCFAADRTAEFMHLLQMRGMGAIEHMDYGFLVRVNGVLLDCEPCHPTGELSSTGQAIYEIEDTPPGACPIQKEGLLRGNAVRCVSWAALLWGYFYYLQEVPYADWPLKDRNSYQLVRQTIGEAEVATRHAQFLSMTDSD